MSNYKHSKPSGHRLYPNLAKAVTEALYDIFQEGHYADKVIERLLKSNPQWGSRDRAFLAETVYDMVRWYRLLYEIRGAEPQNHADWLRLFGIWRVINEEPLPDWEEFKSLHVASVLEKYRRLRIVRAIRESIPDWLDEIGNAEIGTDWDAMLQALNQPAKVVLRANLLKTSTIELQQSLLKEDIETDPMSNVALLVVRRQNLFSSKAFREGWFEVQDYASQQVAPFLNVEPGMRVVDACAGAGGKSLHLADLMLNKGQIISMDTDARKLEELRKRARRADVNIIETRLIDNSKVIKRLEASADRVLLDVPCSGLGVLRRNPDAKWKLRPDFLDQVRTTQQDILNNYSRMCKPGGQLVYATCSILPSENERQVAIFLEKQAGKFECVVEQSISPTAGFDGFYMALLQKV